MLWIEYQLSDLHQKRKHGFLARLRTRSGRRYLQEGGREESTSHTDSHNCCLFTCFYISLSVCDRTSVDMCSYVSMHTVCECVQSLQMCTQSKGIHAASLDAPCSLGTYVYTLNSDLYYFSFFASFVCPHIMADHLCLASSWPVHW